MTSIVFTWVSWASDRLYFDASLTADMTMRTNLAALEAHTDFQSQQGVAEAAKYIDAVKEAEGDHMPAEDSARMWQRQPSRCPPD